MKLQSSSQINRFGGDSSFVALIKNIRILYITVTFIFLDGWLRVMTRWIGQYSIYELEPNLFTVSWSILLTLFIFTIPNQVIRKIIYGILYFILAIYAIIQYGYYLIFDKFLYLTDFGFASEASDYSSYILDVMTFKLVLSIILIITIGVIGVVSFPCKKNRTKRGFLFKTVGVIICTGVIVSTPNMYEGEANINVWDAFSNHAFEYEHFINSGYDMELTGMYQYIVRDAYLHLYKTRTKTVDDDVLISIEAYFENKEHCENTMTGVFKGKNLIVVMMESMDDWLITEEDTPTIWKMMQTSIDFTNMYTPGYASGYTFNTEFAFNTSVYPYSTGNLTYVLIDNNFSYSLPAMFFKAGYNVNSFHEGRDSFYNRGVMHEAIGYEKYTSYRSYDYDLFDVEDDRYLYKCDDLYNDVVTDAPFMSFIITFSPHVPYNETDKLTQIALEEYPQYAKNGITEEASIKAKARLTDDMFAGLLNRLEKDGILEDTVIVGFADHYAYGLNDKELLQQRSEEAGNSILENTPAFIYSTDIRQKISVEKVMQITDLAPTIMNMFGFDVPIYVMGSDIFDDSYEGYAIFPNNTWVTNQAYVKQGNLIYNNGMNEEEIQKMNEFLQETYIVNDYILDADYFKYCDPL